MKKALLSLPPGLRSGRLRKGITGVFFVLAGVVAPLVAVPASASRPAEETFDVTLLRADAVTFFTVKGSDTAADDTEAVDIRPGEHRFVRNVLKSNKAISTLRVAGSKSVDGKVQVSRSGETFSDGKRYLAFFKGGTWTKSPLMHTALPLLPVENGIVKCPDGGSVYGVGPGGLVCSFGKDQAGPPLTEDEVFDALSKRLAKAQLRRPATSRTLDASRLEFSLTRAIGR
jgi:hypothetical protein